MDCAQLRERLIPDLDIVKALPKRSDNIYDFGFIFSGGGSIAIIYKKQM